MSCNKWPAATQLGHMLPALLFTWTCWTVIMLDILDTTSPPFFISTANNASADRPNITIGFLTSFKSGVGKIIAGAIPLAIEHVNNDSMLLPNHTLRFLAGDTQKPHSAHAIRLMTKMREAGVSAFIGPDELCSAEALVAAAWNSPMITYKCADGKVSNKSIYPTFVRTLPPSSKISKALISLLKYFQWNKVVLVVSNNPTDRQIEDAFVELAKTHQIQITRTFYLAPNYLSRYADHIRGILDESYRSTRVYILLVDTHAVADLARHLHSSGHIQAAEYVLIAVEDEEFYDPLKKHQYFNNYFSQLDRKELSWSNGELHTPFRSVLLLTPSPPKNPNYGHFCDLVNQKSHERPFNVPMHRLIKPQVPIYAALAYDAVIIYARALTKVLQQNESVTNGSAVIRHILNQSYESILGFTDRIDENGDADGNYTLLALTPDAARDAGSTPSDSIGSPLLTSPIDPVEFSLQNRMLPVGRFEKSTHIDRLPVLVLERPINWLGKSAPKGEPKCGFDGSKCVQMPSYIWPIAFSTAICLIVLVISLVFRHYRYEYKLARKLWGISFREVLILKITPEMSLLDFRNAISQVKNIDKSKLATSDFILPKSEFRNDSAIGFYCGNTVFIKKIHKKNIEFSRTVCKGLMKLFEMRNENILPFIGISLDSVNMYELTMYCARGSLEDILRNKDVNLNGMFIASLISDLIKGMIYLHESQLMTHGRLQSSNCLVDSRWVLQIGGFGLEDVRANEIITADIERKRKKALLWKAPEVLRQGQLSTCPLPLNTALTMNLNDHLPAPASGGNHKVRKKCLTGSKTPLFPLQKKADVYSFAIILYEILGRQGPWGTMLSAADRDAYFVTSACYPHTNRPMATTNRPMLHETGMRWLYEASDESSHSTGTGTTAGPAHGIARSISSDLHKNEHVFTHRAKRFRSQSALDQRRSPPKDTTPMDGATVSVVIEGGSESTSTSTHRKPSIASLEFGAADNGQTDPKRANSARGSKQYGGRKSGFWSRARINTRSNELTFEWKASETDKQEKENHGNASRSGDVELSIDQIVERLCHPAKFNNVVLRPEVRSITSWPSFLVDCMCICWDEQPEMRPDFRRISTMLRDMLASCLKSNIFDNMLSIMEIYSSNLEELVDVRTKQLLEEKKKAEGLLLQMLPKPVAEQLKKGLQVKAEFFDCVTIYFSDIVGFTTIAADSTPLEVVNLLNDLYTCFDSVTENYNVYKVETIGDAYMVAGGLKFCNSNLKLKSGFKFRFEDPKRAESPESEWVKRNSHAGEVAGLALHMLLEIKNCEKHHRSGEPVKLRIGIHSGPVVGGVVGMKMPRYCLFGDTVNTASRMESTGEALRIHVSEDCKNILTRLGGFILEERGLTYLKGKGEKQTYWLTGLCNPPTDDLHFPITSLRKPISSIHVPNL